MYGLCECGCGQQTNLATQTRAARGWVRGEPKRFVKGHVKPSSETIERARIAKLKHGHALHGWSSPTYGSWTSMRDRCLNPASKDYKHYGGRGITICERWERFENFLSDMGEKLRGLTIERIDNNGNYEPGNCRWATIAEQNKNRRNVIHIEFEGRQYTTGELAAIIGLSRQDIYKSVKASKSLR